MLLSKTNNFQTNLFERILIDTTTLSQNGSGSNGNERVLYIPQISKTKASLSDVVLCHIQDTQFLDGVLLPLRILIPTDNTNAFIHLYRVSILLLGLSLPLDTEGFQKHFSINDLNPNRIFLFTK